jgi:uncharacterized membrane protein
VRDRLVGFRDYLLGTLWFVPLLIVVAALVLAVGMVELSSHVDDEALRKFPRVFGASASSSRSILSGVASSMITVAGLTFSLTMLAVTQATSQYTPRILRNFLGDRPNQLVLGTFVGIFTYCIVVVRTIRSEDDDGGRFVPSLAVVLGIVLAIVGMGVLIYFVHHIATTLQASNILARVARETLAAIDRLFPQTLGDEAHPGGDRAARAVAAVTRWHPVPARTTGYVQGVHEDRLLHLAGTAKRIVRMERGVGEFAVEGTPVASIAAERGAAGLRATHPASGDVRSGPPADDDLDGLARRVAGAYRIAEYRTVDQDAAFGVRQIVDIALKALSPSTNDSTTAATCVDYLGAVLVRLTDRRIESAVREEDGEVRVLARGPTFESLLRLACDEVRQSAAANPRLLQRLLDVLAQAATCTTDRRRCALLAEQMALIHEVAERTIPAPADRERLRAGYIAASRAVR